jgi:hypothetical protein
MALRDENVEAVRDARESLVRKYGGLSGWFRHLQRRDQKRTTSAGAGRGQRKSVAVK